MQITQQTKLREKQSSSSCRVCRAVLFDKLDTGKMHYVERVDTYRVKT